MKITREIKTGILALLAIALFIFGYQFLKGKNLLGSDRTFYVKYKNVQGVTTSSYVTINGMQIGKVMKITKADNKNNLLVTITVYNNDFEFSKNSIAKIYSPDLIGGKAISINPVYDNSPMAEDGDTLKGGVEEGLIELVNHRLNPLQEKIETAIVSADSVLTAINGILSTGSRNNLQNIFSDLSMTMRSFKKTAGTFDKVLQVNEPKLNQIFTNIDQMSDNLNKTSDSLSQANIGQIVSNLDVATKNFANLSRDLQQGRGTAGKLLKDEKLYDNLEGASQELEKLLEDLKLHPKRYVHFSLFGKKPGPYEETESQTN